ncbi:MAG TPA: NERD domain-containing protein [Anaerolineales bacterium]|nr:NERD domain-containing protein [Anaerolineales bacterium]
MKIIDKTPLLNEKGELGFFQRIQGMMKFGYDWPSELQAQKAIITYFDRQLEKGYTLIRNYTLGKSGITVPIILLGPTGIHVIHVAYLKGRYEASGEAWNQAAGDGYKPASVNLVQQTMRMARAVKAFIERQGVKVPVEVEPVLIAGDPGLHIQTNRPAIRILMIDGVKSFVSNLVTAQPTLSAESVYEFTERLLNPRPPRKPSAGVPSAPEQPLSAEPPVEEVSRARAIFDASEHLKPFDPADFDFAMLEEEAAGFDLTPPVASPAGPVSPAKPPRKRVLGMTLVQLALLLVLVFVCVCVIVAGIAIYILALS